MSNKGKGFNSLFYVLHKKYGSDFEKSYNDLSLKRVRSWGLNTLGAWSKAASEQSPALKTPYTLFVWTSGGRPIKPFGKLRDPFDPDLVSKMLKSFERSMNCTQLRSPMEWPVPTINCSYQ